MVNDFHKMKCDNFLIITAITAVIMVLSDLTTDVPVDAAIIVLDYGRAGRSVRGGGNFQSKINVCKHELAGSNLQQFQPSRSVIQLLHLIADRHEID